MAKFNTTEHKIMEVIEIKKWLEEEESTVDLNIKNKKHEEKETGDCKLSQHMTSKQTVKETCQTSFSSQKDLAKHFDAHDGLNCYNNFTQKELLKCSVCDAGFTLSASLKQHVATVHEG